MAGSGAILDCQRCAESAVGTTWTLQAVSGTFIAHSHSPWVWVKTASPPGSCSVGSSLCGTSPVPLNMRLRANWLDGGFGKRWGWGREDLAKKAVQPLRHPLFVAGTLNHKGPSSLCNWPLQCG
ncbi:hypothetical protein HJG60_008934 [Phyllostomus discolor]|uniref:Uncharacterized protein n=1 Tax=Phyllostomus discolor TaxID=89673 RepID=A0A833YWK1_9CHIR|nr:hypothetical protein HJG60_008934 [Phyllostomus discolor]